MASAVVNLVSPTGTGSLQAWSTIGSSQANFSPPTLLKWAPLSGFSRPAWKGTVLDRTSLTYTGQRRPSRRSLTVQCAASRQALALEAHSLHKVERGESLWAIARKHGVSVGELSRLNPEVDQQALWPGQVLIVGARGEANQGVSVAEAKAVTSGHSAPRNAVEQVEVAVNEAVAAGRPQFQLPRQLVSTVQMAQQFTTKGALSQKLWTWIGGTVLVALALLFSKLWRKRGVQNESPAPGKNFRTRREAINAAVSGKGSRAVQIVESQGVEYTLTPQMPLSERSQAVAVEEPAALTLEERELVALRAQVADLTQLVQAATSRSQGQQFKLDESKVASSMMREQIRKALAEKDELAAKAMSLEVVLHEQKERHADELKLECQRLADAKRKADEKSLAEIQKLKGALSELQNSRREEREALQLKDQEFEKLQEQLEEQVALEDMQKLEAQLQEEIQKQQEENLRLQLKLQESETEHTESEQMLQQEVQRLQAEKADTEEHLSSLRQEMLAVKQELESQAVTLEQDLQEERNAKQGLLEVQAKLEKQLSETREHGIHVVEELKSQLFAAKRAEEEQYKLCLDLQQRLQIQNSLSDTRAMEVQELSSALDKSNQGAKQSETELGSLRSQLEEKEEMSSAMLLRARQDYETANRLQKELKNLETSLTEARQKQSTLETQYASLQVKHEEELQAVRDSSERMIENLQEAVSTSERKLKEVESALASTREKLERERDAREKAESNAVGLQEDSERAEQSLVDLELKLQSSPSGERMLVWKKEQEEESAQLQAQLDTKAYQANVAKELILQYMEADKERSSVLFSLQRAYDNARARLTELETGIELELDRRLAELAGRDDAAEEQRIKVATALMEAQASAQEHVKTLKQELEATKQQVARLEKQQAAQLGSSVSQVVPQEREAQLLRVQIEKLERQLAEARMEATSQAALKDRELKHLQGQLTELEGTYRERFDEVQNTLVAQLETTQEELLERTSALSALQTELGKARDELQEAQQTCEMNGNKIATLVAELRTKTEQLAGAERQLAAMSKEAKDAVSQFKEELQVMQIAKQELAADVAARDRTVAELAEKVAELEGQVSSDERVTQLLGQIESLEGDMEKLRAEHGSDLMAIRSEEQAKRDLVRSELSEARSELRSLEGRLLGQQRDLLQLEKKEQLVAKLHQDVDHLQQKLAQAELKAKQAEEAVQRSETEVTRYQEKLKAEVSEKEKLGALVSAKSQELEALNARLALFRVQATEVLKERDSELETAKKEIEGSRIELKKAERAKEVVEEGLLARERQVVERAQASAAYLGVRLADTEDVLQSLEKTLEAQRQALAASEKELVSSVSGLKGQLQRETKARESAEKALSDLRERVADVSEDEVQKLQEELVRREQIHSEELTGLKQRLESAVKAKEQQVQEMKDTLSELEKQYAREVAGRKEALKEFKTTRGELEGIERALTKANEAVVDLQRKVDSQVEGALEDRKRQLEGMKAQLTEIEKELQKERASKNYALKQLESQMSQVGKKHEEERKKWEASRRQMEAVLVEREERLKLLEKRLLGAESEAESLGVRLAEKERQAAESVQKLEARHRQEVEKLEEAYRSQRAQLEATIADLAGKVQKYKAAVTDAARGVAMAVEAPEQVIGTSVVTEPKESRNGTLASDSGVLDVLDKRLTSSEEQAESLKKEIRQRVTRQAEWQDPSNGKDGYGGQIEKSRQEVKDRVAEFLKAMTPKFQSKDR